MHKASGHWVAGYDVDVYTQCADNKLLSTRGDRGEGHDELTCRPLHYHSRCRAGTDSTMQIVSPSTRQIRCEVGSQDSATASHRSRPTHNAKRLYISNL